MVSLQIVHFMNHEDFRKELTENPGLISKAHLVSYSYNDDIMITKSRWFTGEYTCYKLGFDYLVDIKTYGKIVQDTINRFITG
jgi:hypothetical protein